MQKLNDLLLLHLSGALEKFLALRFQLSKHLHNLELHL